MLDMGNDQLIFSPKHCKELDCTTKFMTPQIKLKPAKKTVIAETPSLTILKHQKTSVPAVPLPQVPVKIAKSKPVKAVRNKTVSLPESETITEPLDIAFIDAAAFNRLNTRKQH